jgi:hypothetical protein
MTYARFPGSTPAAGACALSASMRSRSASRQTTSAAWGGSPSGRGRRVSRSGAPESASMKASRSAGYAGSSGT